LKIFTNTGVTIALLLLLNTSAIAGNDASIKGDLRSNIQYAMGQYIKQNTINGKMYIYDPVKGNLLKLAFDKLHTGIVKKGSFYVSCADFKDQQGRKIDIDFMVIPDDTSLTITQALVHSIDGNKRQYHLENL